MTIQHHFTCATPSCRGHVHVTIVCHDLQTYDVTALAAAFGFRRGDEQLISANPWHCVEHTSKERSL